MTARTRAGNGATTERPYTQPREGVLDGVIHETQRRINMGFGPNGFQPTDLEQVFQIAKLYMDAKLNPRGMDTLEKMVVAIEYGVSVGMSASQAIQSVAVINGRPTIWGDMMLGLCRASGQLEDIEEHRIPDGKDDGFGYECIVKRKGQETPHIHTFTVANAKRSKLWGKEGPWMAYPQRMLQMRARSWALRDAFADVLKGLQCREEVEDELRSQGIEIPEGVFDRPDDAPAKPSRVRESDWQIPAATEQEPNVGTEADPGEVVQHEPADVDVMLKLEENLAACNNPEQLKAWHDVYFGPDSELDAGQEEVARKRFAFHRERIAKSGKPKQGNLV